MDAILFTQWMWLIIAIILLVLELILPGTFLVWLGLAAGAVGLSVWTWLLPIPAQLGLFAAYSVLAILLGRRLQRKKAGEDAVLNQGPAALVGERVVVSQAITNGKGRVAVGDTSWIARGPDLPEGTAVTITGHEGSQLIVEAPEG